MLPDELELEFVVVLPVLAEVLESVVVVPVLADVLESVVVVPALAEVLEPVVPVLVDAFEVVDALALVVLFESALSEDSFANNRASAFASAFAS